MATWVGSDAQYLYNLDRFAEVGVEARTDGVYVIRAWSQPAVLGADGRRYPRGDVVTLAELMTPDDLDSALSYLRERICQADFQVWGSQE